ncbi:XdhC family protein, partial [Streptomonospora algeriensis]
MRDIRTAVAEMYAAGDTFALATVIDTYSSAPREAGAAMAVGPQGEVAGSVSGGCVEGAVYELSQQVLSTGEPARATYGVSDDEAFAVGLTCGGTLHVLVEPVDPVRHPHLGPIIADIEAHRPVAVSAV